VSWREYRNQFSRTELGAFNRARQAVAFALPQRVIYPVAIYPVIGVTHIIRTSAIAENR
jgi:hypothetical protein